MCFNYTTVVVSQCSDKPNSKCFYVVENIDVTFVCSMPKRGRAYLLQSTLLQFHFSCRCRCLAHFILINTKTVIKITSNRFAFIYTKMTSMNFTLNIIYQESQLNYVHVYYEKIVLKLMAFQLCHSDTRCCTNCRHTIKYYLFQFPNILFCMFKSCMY